MEDAAGFFANVFGGERFMDYVSHKWPTRLNIASRLAIRLAKYLS